MALKALRLKKHDIIYICVKESISEEGLERSRNVTSRECDVGAVLEMRQYHILYNIFQYIGPIFILAQYYIGKYWYNIWYWVF